MMSKSQRNWCCPQCSRANAFNTKSCSECKYPETVLPPRESSKSTELTPKQKEKQLMKFDIWECRKCSYHNKIEREVCEICYQEKPSTPYIENPQPTIEGNWDCPRCTFVNKNFFDFCQICEFAKVYLDSYQKPQKTEKKKGPSRQSLASSSSVGFEKEDIIQILSDSLLGSNPIGPTQVLFKVWSPNADKVFVSGSFNDWMESDESFELERHPEMNDLFYGIFIDIPSDSEYKYVIHTKDNKVLWRNDPRTLQIVEGKNDQNSKVFDPMQFKWSSFNPPAWNNLILYELHVASFTKEGTFRAAVDHFGYLNDLNITAIALMPINQDYHTKCWGYDPISLFTIHSTFGTPEDLQYFVDEAHKRDISVILDWVPNHMAPKNILLNFDSVSEDSDGPFFYPDNRKITDFGPKLDYSSPQVRSYIKDSAITFLQLFNFDGIRVDSTGTMRKKHPDTDEQNQEAWTLMQEINDLVHKKFPNKIMIAEDLEGNPSINYSLAGFDSQWDAKFFSIALTVTTEPSDENRRISQISEAICHQYHSMIHSRIIYTENHDTIPGNRLKRMPEAICNGKGDENLFAIKKSTLIAGIMATSPGLPMILQGQEILETASPVWPHPPSVDWSRKEKFKGIFDLYQNLFALRQNKFKNTLGLTSGNVQITHENEIEGVISFHRFDRGGPGDDVIVIANFSNSVYSNYRLGFPRSGKWYVRMNTDSNRYCSLFENHGAPKGTEIETEKIPYDGFFFSASIKLGRYSMLILSMDPLDVLK